MIRILYGCWFSYPLFTCARWFSNTRENSSECSPLRPCQLVRKTCLRQPTRKKSKSIFKSFIINSASWLHVVALYVYEFAVLAISSCVLKYSYPVSVLGSRTLNQYLSDNMATSRVMEKRVRKYFVPQIDVCGKTVTRKASAEKWIESDRAKRRPIWTVSIFCSPVGA